MKDEDTRVDLAPAPTQVSILANMPLHTYLITINIQKRATHPSPSLCQWQQCCLSKWENIQTMELSLIQIIHISPAIPVLVCMYKLGCRGSEMSRSCNYIWFMIIYMRVYIYIHIHTYLYLEASSGGPFRDTHTISPYTQLPSLVNRTWFPSSVTLLFQYFYIN